MESWRTYWVLLALRSLLYKCANREVYHGFVMSKEFVQYLLQILERHSGNPKSFVVRLHEAFHFAVGLRPVISYFPVCKAKISCKRFKACAITWEPIIGLYCFRFAIRREKLVQFGFNGS